MRCAGQQPSGVRLVEAKASPNLALCGASISFYFLQKRQLLGLQHLGVVTVPTTGWVRTPSSQTHLPCFCVPIRGTAVQG